MSIKSLYSNEEEEWKNTEEYDITRLHDANPTHLSTKNNEGQLPIHCAIAAADISVIKKMHELNKDGVSVKEGHLSWTALHLAVYLGRDDLVPFLISVYSPAAKLSDSEGQLPIDIAKATDDDTNEVKQSKKKILRMLENLDDTIKEYKKNSSSETATGRKDDKGSSVNTTMTGHTVLEDGRIMTQDGKIKRKVRSDDKSTIICFVSHPSASHHAYEIVQGLMDKYEYTSHKIKLILEKKRENLSNESKEKMLTKELIDDDEMIEIIKRYVKKNINLPGGIIHGFPLTENQYNASIDKSKKIIPSYIILLDEPGGEEDVEDEEIISKIERFHLIKDIVRGRADELESLNIKTKSLYIDCTDRKADEILKDIIDKVGANRAEKVAAVKLQANARGFMARKSLVRSRFLLVKCQARWRGIMVRKRASLAKELKEKHNEHDFFDAWVTAFDESNKSFKKIKSVFRRNRNIQLQTLYDKWLKLDDKNNVELETFLRVISDSDDWEKYVVPKFKRKDKKDQIILNFTEMIEFVNEHGAHVHESRLEETHRLRDRVMLLEFAARKNEFEDIFKKNANENGEITIAEFHNIFLETSKAWGYDGDALEVDSAEEKEIFKSIKVKTPGHVTWDEFHTHMDDLAHGDARKFVNKIVDKSKELDKELRKHRARKHRKVIDTNFEYETESDDDDDDVNSDTGDDKMGKFASPYKRKEIANRNSPKNKISRSPGSPVNEAYVVDQSKVPDKKKMLIRIFKKYRQGLHRLFQFYSKANMGEFHGRSFEQISKEHSGVNLTMFRLMVKDLGLITEKRLKYKIEAARRRFEREGKIGDMPFEDYVNEVRPYTTKEVVDKCFRYNSTLLKCVSSVSQGKGILSKPQFTMALGKVAVELLGNFPWKERYPEAWRRVDAVFGRLDLNNLSELNKRLRGKGGFCIGDGDISGHTGSMPTTQKLTLSYPLRLPGDPPTPPPTSPRKPKFKNRSNKPTRSFVKADIDKRNGELLFGNGALTSQQNRNNMMTISLATQFGIDDTINDFGNPYDSSYGYDQAENNVLNTLNLSYGVEQDRANMNNNDSSVYNNNDGNKMGRGRGLQIETKVNADYKYDGLAPPPSSPYLQDVIQSTGGSGKPYVGQTYQNISKGGEFDPYSSYNSNSRSTNYSKNAFTSDNKFVDGVSKVVVGKFDDDHMWSMSWNELESDFEPTRAMPYNERSHIRRREKERANFERIKLKQPPQNSKRRNTNRKSPLAKRTTIPNYNRSNRNSITNLNHNSNNVPKYRMKNTGISDLSSSIPRSSRTPGRHISREQFNSMKSPRRGRRRGIGHGRSTFAGRDSVASPDRSQRGLRGMKKY